MTLKQIAWAKQHDWFMYESTSSIDGTLTAHVRDDMYTGVLLFTDFNELYIWAGY